MSSYVRVLAQMGTAQAVEFSLSRLASNSRLRLHSGRRDPQNSSTAQPTDEQLNAVDSAADLSERQAAARSARRAAYGDWNSQLDMQYHDNVDGTTTWKDHVAKVKTDNPIPTE